ncbi:MAG: Alpha/Beta hydrolase protein [Monoraphidium minutum]|nr:MAG: Alpha/Beta hydrolase protein [Monoraphidium minutum]
MAGVTSQAFEGLLSGGGPLSARAAPPAGHAAADPGAAAEEQLLPPVLPLHRGAERFAWAAPDGAPLEVICRRGVAQEGDAAAGAPQRPPLVFIHGLFRGAWCFDEALMPALAAAGYDCYALSLRGQGASALGAGISKVAAAAGGVPLAVNVADIAAFLGSLPPGPAPVLVGHSLGGTFVQEYLALFAAQEAGRRRPGGGDTGSGGPQRGESAKASAPPPLVMPPLPRLAGAAALASACAGTVMAFRDFVADVGLREFAYQMYIVFSSAHLKDGAVARYCWWGERLPAGDAERYHAAVRASSRAPPYIAAEIGGWAPAPPRGAAGGGGGATGAEGRQREQEGREGRQREQEGREGQQREQEGREGRQQREEEPLLPPVLAVGGAEDRIIRPFQVEAFAGQWGARVSVLPGVEAFAWHWGARVSVLPGVTHDLILGGQALRVAVELLAWLEALPPCGRGCEEGGAGCEEGEALPPCGHGGEEGGERGGEEGGEGSVEAPAAAVRVLPLTNGHGAPAPEQHAVSV